MPKRPIEADDLLRIQFLGDPQISPDGDRVLFTVKQVGDKNKYRTHLYCSDLDGSISQWTSGEHSISMPRWSPTGDRVAFISSRESKKSQIFVMPTAGGEAVRQTDLPEGSIGEFKWSPDGTKIAFTFRQTAHERTEKFAKEREESGASQAPWVLDDIWYRLDGDGYFGDARFRIWLLDLSTGTSKELYSACPLGMYSFDWAPHSKEIVVAHTNAKRPMADPPDDQLFRVDLTGQAWKLDGLPKGEKHHPCWSPDGKKIAYLGDVSEDDPWGVRNTKLYVVNAEGGTPMCLTESDDYCLTASTLSDVRDFAGDGFLAWSADAMSLFVQVGTKGEVQLGVVDATNGGLHFLTQGRHAIAAGNVDRGGLKIAYLSSTPTQLADLFVLDLGEEPTEPRRLTHFNKELQERLELSEPEEVWLESSDGWPVHAWVMKPIGYLPPKRYPAILEIHGGPHAQYGWSFFHEFQLLAAQGFVVVFSNPRGSKGYGEAHCAAIKGDWGNRDWEDIQTVTRWMQHQPYIHPGQMGVMGGSYGGYMTNWVVGHTDEYRAAITDRCVSNMVSMGGNSDFPFNKNGYFKGSCWGDLEAIRELWKQSPIAFFEKVNTPMLIIHSEGDLRCNIEQSEQVFTALQQRGIESRFVRYPSSTSHGMSRNGPPDLRLHRLGQIVWWWNRHLK